MIPLSLLSAALAGSVYINGVRADVLPEVTLNNVTVRFDGDGNVWVDAPGYRVQVLPPVAQGAPASTAPPPAAPTSTPPSAATAPAATAPPVRPASTAGPAYAVPRGAWWLVSEDNASAGQAVEVLVNGTLAKRVTSGEPQIILDLAPWLRPGANTIVMNPVPSSTQGGGALSLYVGRGNNLSGTIHLDNPDVVFTRRASDAGGAKQYTLTVP